LGGKGANIHAELLPDGYLDIVMHMYEFLITVLLKQLMCTPQNKIRRERWCTQKSRLETPDLNF